MPIIVILALFLGLPLIELFFLIKVGAFIGALPTIALSILTAVIGTALVRHQGFGVLLRVGRLTDAGELPALELLDGALLLIAGLALLLPGFLTDLCGFLLLVPPLRHWLIRRYVGVQPLGQGLTAGHAERLRREQVRIIEGDYRRDD